MLDELRQYYDRLGISAEPFACRYENSCRSVCTDMVTPREAFVGSIYEDGILPRLLFVSLETHRLAYEMLNPIAMTLVGQPIEFGSIHKYFAHTNSAKCKDSARNTAQGHDQMFDNCRGFIAAEIELKKFASLFFIHSIPSTVVSLSVFATESSSRFRPSTKTIVVESFIGRRRARIRGTAK